MTDKGYIYTYKGQKMALKDKNLAFISDRDAARLIGARLRQYRILARLTQKDVASRTGVSLATVKNIEKGQTGTIDHLIAFLRATGRIEQLNGLVEPPQASPLQLAKAQKPLLQRIRKKRVE